MHMHLHMHTYTHGLVHTLSCSRRIMPTLKGVDKSTIIVLVCASTKRSVPAVKVLQHAVGRAVAQSSYHSFLPVF